MAYVYLTDMFQFIDQRLSRAKTALDSADSDSDEKWIQKGRVEALTEFKQFLAKDYIPKLPSRIRKAYSMNQR